MWKYKNISIIDFLCKKKMHNLCKDQLKGKIFFIKNWLHLKYPWRQHFLAAITMKEARADWQYFVSGHSVSQSSGVMMREGCVESVWPAAAAETARAGHTPLCWSWSLSHNTQIYTTQTLINCCSTEYWRHRKFRVNNLHRESSERNRECSCWRKFWKWSKHRIYIIN